MRILSKAKKKIIEFRNYSLQTNFPILLLSGDEWHISDIPSTRLHFHNCLEIGLCEEGSGSLEFMNKVLPFHTGDITLIASDVIHTTYSTPGTSSKWSYIFIDVEEFFHPYFSLDILSQNDMIQKIIYSYSSIFSKDKYPEIYNIVIHIIHTLKNKDLNYKYAIFGTLMAFLVDVMNIYITPDDPERSNIQTSGNSLVITPALDYIRKSYMMDFSMESLAQLCSMSSTHFRRTFSSVMNTSPLEYLIKFRIEKASLFLQTTDMPILNISEEVGFHSLSSFNRHFSRIMGETPRDWRKKMSFAHNLSIFQNTGWMTPPKI